MKTNELSEILNDYNVEDIIEALKVKESASEVLSYFTADEIAEHVKDESDVLKKVMENLEKDDLSDIDWDLLLSYIESDLEILQELSNSDIVSIVENNYNDVLDDILSQADTSRLLYAIEDKADVEKFQTLGHTGKIILRCGDEIVFAKNAYLNHTIYVMEERL